MPTHFSMLTSTCIADTGSTGHFINIHAPILNQRPANPGISVLLPDGSTITSTHTAILNIPMLPPTACEAHLPVSNPRIWLPHLHRQTLRPWLHRHLHRRLRLHHPPRHSPPSRHALRHHQPLATPSATSHSTGPHPLPLHHNRLSHLPCRQLRHSPTNNRRSHRILPCHNVLSGPLHVV